MEELILWSETFLTFSSFFSPQKDLEKELAEIERRRLVSLSQAYSDLHSGDKVTCRQFLFLYVFVDP